MTDQSIPHKATNKLKTKYIRADESLRLSKTKRPKMKVDETKNIIAKLYGFMGLLSTLGKGDDEGCAVAGLRFDVNRPVVLFHNAIGHRQPKACAFSHVFGGKKWVEDF